MTSQISFESLNLSWVHRILLCSFCLAWNSLPELISGRVGIRMSWVENFLKINKRGGGTSIRDQRVRYLLSCVLKIEQKKQGPFLASFCLPRFGIASINFMLDTYVF